MNEQQVADSAQEQLEAARREIEQLVAQRQQEQGVFQETYDEQCRALGEATLQLRVLSRRFNEINEALGQAQTQVQELQAVVTDQEPEPGLDGEPDEPVSRNREGGFFDEGGDDE